MQTIYNILWGIVGFAIIAGTVAMSLSAPTPYGFAKGAFVVAAGFFVALVYLWGLFAENNVRMLKLYGGLAGVVVPIIIIPVLFWYIDMRYERGLLEFAAMDISDISNSDLKTRTSLLIDRINDFQLTSSQTIIEIIQNDEYFDPKTTTEAERRLRFLEKTRRLTSETVRQNNEWRRHFLPEVLAIISIAKERVPSAPQPDQSAQPGLQGILAGIAPASEVAKYLSIVVSKLPN